MAIKDPKGYELKPWWPYINNMMEGGSGLQLEELNVTANGVYTPDTGKAYNKVNVNVSGGGGSSDFSTAHLRFELRNPQATDNVALVGEFGRYNYTGVFLHEPDEEEPYYLRGLAEVKYNIPTVELDVLLYKNSASFALEDGTAVLTTGGVSVEDGRVTITSDGTLTVVAQS